MLNDKNAFISFTLILVPQGLKSGYEIFVQNITSIEILKPVAIAELRYKWLLMRFETVITLSIELKENITKYKSFIQKENVFKIQYQVNK